MDKQNMHKLREKLCKELSMLSTRSDLSIGDLGLIHKLTDTIKNIDKINMFEEGGYSEARGRSRSSYASMSYGDNSYDGSRYGDSDYSDRARHYVRGHYSNHSKKDLLEYMEELMDETTSEHERAALHRCISQLKGV